MTTDELVAVSQDRDSNDEMATKQFLSTRILFNHHKNAVQWNIGTPASQNSVSIRILIFLTCVNFFNAR